MTSESVGRSQACPTVGPPARSMRVRQWGPCEGDGEVHAGAVVQSRAIEFRWIRRLIKPLRDVGMSWAIGFRWKRVPACLTKPSRRQGSQGRGWDAHMGWVIGFRWIRRPGISQPSRRQGPCWLLRRSCGWPIGFDDLLVAMTSGQEREHGLFSDTVLELESGVRVWIHTTQTKIRKIRPHL